MPAMRPLMNGSMDHRRRFSMCLTEEAASSTSLPDSPGGQRRASSSHFTIGGTSIGSGSGSRSGSVSGVGSQFLMVPDLRYRRASTQISTSTSALCVPQDSEPRRRSLPGYIDQPPSKSRSAECLLDRRRSSVRPDEVYEQINNDATRNTKIFGIVMILFLAFVIGVSFFKLFQHHHRHH